MSDPVTAEPSEPLDLLGRVHEGDVRRGLDEERVRQHTFLHQPGPPLQAHEELVVRVHGFGDVDLT